MCIAACPGRCALLVRSASKAQERAWLCAVGAGNAEGGLDGANILKPALARGELQCIGATTLDEYRQHIEPDAAFTRRFQVRRGGKGADRGDRGLGGGYPLPTSFTRRFQVQRGGEGGR